MTKVSSGKPKKGPPAYANSYAFHHNKSSKLTKHIGSLPIRFLCPGCVAVIEWRKKYRKYKPLTVVKRCTGCGEKKVKDAYHVICGECVGKLGKCGKCLVPREQWIKEGTELEIGENGEISAIKSTAVVGGVSGGIAAADPAVDLDLDLDLEDEDEGDSESYDETDVESESDSESEDTDSD